MVKSHKKKYIGRMIIVIAVGIYIIYQSGYAIGKFRAHFEKSKSLKK